MVDTATSSVPTKQPDTSVKLPRAVQEAAARATELSEKFRTAGSMAITDIRSGEIPVVDVKPTSGPTTMAPTPSGGAGGAATVAPSKTYTEQDFKSMQGRFERSQQENKQLADRLNELQRIAAYVQAPTQPGPITPISTLKLITDKEREEYGDVIEVMRKAAREVADPEIAALKAEVSNLRQGVGAAQQHVAMTATERVYQELHKEVPDWESYNNPDGEHNQGFMTWLNQIDPLSGTQRKSLLTNAFNTGQASRVVAAFKGYKAELAALDPAQVQGSRSGNGALRSDGNSGNASPDNSRSNGATTPTVDLTALAAPGRARSGQVPTSPDKPIITRDEITNFYSEVTRGKWTGREKEKDAIEKQIFEAHREGRIR